MKVRARRSSADEDLKIAAMRLLASREHSRLELRDKLEQRYPGDARISQTVDELARQGLQSDERFAEAFARERYRRGIGPIRVRVELKQRGLASALIEDVLADPDFDWQERLVDVAERKFGDEPTRDPRELAQRTRFLQQRGFAQDDVRRLLRTMSTA